MNTLTHHIAPAAPATTGREHRLEEALRDMVFQAEREGWSEQKGEKRAIMAMAQRVLNEATQ